MIGTIAGVTHFRTLSFSSAAEERESSAPMPSVPPGSDSGDGSMNPGRTDKHAAKTSRRNVVTNDPEMRSAVNSFTVASNAIENKNAQLLFSKTIDGFDHRGLAIKKPNDADIAAISSALSESLKDVPAEKSKNARAVLQKLYDERTQFRGNYRVLYILQKVGFSARNVIVADVKEPENVMLTPEGKYRTKSGFVTTGNGDWWKARYGHLVDIAPK
jgi:hypothetical protein